MGHLAWKGTYKILLESLKGGDHLGCLGTDQKTILKWDYIVRGSKWTQLEWFRIKSSNRALVNMVMTPLVSVKGRELFDQFSD
jgi:hypothetical protein